MGTYNPKPPRFQPRPPTRGQSYASTSRGSYDEAVGTENGKGGRDDAAFLQKQKDKERDDKNHTKTRGQKRRTILEGGAAVQSGYAIVEVTDEGTLSENIEGRTIASTSYLIDTTTNFSPKWGTYKLHGPDEVNTTDVHGLDITAASDTDFVFTGDYTMEWWHKKGNGGQFMFVGSDWGTTPGAGDWYVEGASVGAALRLCIHDGATWLVSDQHGAAVFNAWNHFVIERQISTGDVWVGINGTCWVIHGTGATGTLVDGDLNSPNPNLKLMGSLPNANTALIDLETWQGFDGFRCSPTADYDLASNGDAGSYTVPTTFWTS